MWSKVTFRQFFHLVGSFLFAHLVGVYIATLFLFLILAANPAVSPDTLALPMMPVLALMWLPIGFVIALPFVLLSALPLFHFLGRKKKRPVSVFTTAGVLCGTLAGGTMALVLPGFVKDLGGAMFIIACGIGGIPGGALFVLSARSRAVTADIF